MKSKQNLFFQLVVLVALGATAIIMSCNTGHETTKKQNVNKTEESVNSENGKTITVMGMAMHAKAGAVVETENGAYYIEGRHDWGGLYEKKIKVTGKLRVDHYKKEDLVDEKGNYSQGMVGDIHYIVDAKVEEIK